MHQYDVSDPFTPKLTGKVRIGGIVVARHPSRGAANGALNGGPQMVEISRDGRRVYFTNSLYGAIDAAVLSRGPRRLDGEARRRARRRHRLRPEVLHRLAEGPPAAPGAPRRRRLLVGFLLLSVSPRPGAIGVVAMAGPRRARRLPRPQPGHGLAVRGGARPAPRQPPGGAARRCCRSRWGTRLPFSPRSSCSCWPGSSSIRRCSSWRAGLLLVGWAHLAPPEATASGCASA